MKFTPQSKAELIDAIHDWEYDSDDAFAKYGNANEWNITNIEDLSYLFGNKELSETRMLYDFDISNWDTSHVTNMEGLFMNVVMNKGIQFIEKWDVSNVKNMSYMFAGSYSCNNTIDLISWNTSKVKDMSYMFASIQATHSLRHCHIDPININQWNISQVEDMSYMFDHNLAVNQCLDKWDVSNVKNAYGIFRGINDPLNRNYKMIEETQITNFLKYFPEHDLFAEEETIHSRVKKFYKYYKNYQSKHATDPWTIQELKQLQHDIHENCIEKINVAIRRLENLTKYEQKHSDDLFFEANQDGDY